MFVWCQVVHGNSELINSYNFFFIFLFRISSFLVHCGIESWVRCVGFAELPLFYKAFCWQIIQFIINLNTDVIFSYYFTPRVCDNLQLIKRVSEKKKIVTLFILFYQKKKLNAILQGYSRLTTLFVIIIRWTSLNFAVIFLYYIILFFFFWGALWSWTIFFFIFFYFVRCAYKACFNLLVTKIIL